MAYDENLADRIRHVLNQTSSSVEEKKMMGGLTFMVNGKMCVGIIGNEMMARIDPEIFTQTVSRKGCRAMDFTGRPMKGYIMIEPEVMDLDEQLNSWISMALDFNPKAKSSRKSSKKR
jgi:TfoX/Sxy family transcriptional regulator of competence genes